jgi:AraC family transcriptional regulator
VEAFKMDDRPKTAWLPPRIVDGRPLLIAGLGEHFAVENMAGISALWQRFHSHLGHVPGQVGDVAYGVCYNTDDAGHFDYLAGVEVADFVAVPKDFARIRLTEQRYAVFWHGEHVSTVRGTFKAIFNEWLPNSGYRNADAAPFERYDERFNPRTGMGGFEIWIPIQA